MITFVRSAEIMPGQMSAAMAFAGEIKAMVKQINGVELSLLMPVGGNPFMIMWRTTYDSLADMDAAQAKLMGDASYMAKLSETAGLFAPGSIRDQVLRTVG